MDLWFLTDPARLTVERAALDHLGDNSPWLKGVKWTLERGGLHVDVAINIEGREVELRMSYPDLFPAVPPEVRPKDPKQRLSDHQYSSGVLCLEWGPDNWQPTVSGAQMLQSAYRLLKSETLAEDEVPSRHHLSQGQALRGAVYRVFVDQQIEESLADLESIGFSTDFYDDAALITIQRIGSLKRKLPPGLTVEIDSPLYNKGIFLDNVPIALAKIRNLDELHARTTECRGELPAQMTEVQAYFLRDTDGDLHFSFVSSIDSKKLLSASVVKSDKPATRSPFGESAFVGKKVGIVGLGSAGSKIAVSLARSGIREFYLVDDDVLLPENLCRNELNWQHVGRHKVEAVADAVKFVCPDANVDTSRLCLTGQESNAAVNGALRRLGKCDILIDATANPRVFNLMAACAKAFERTFLWLEIFAGGIGGLVARSRPGEYDPQILRAAFNSFTQVNPAPELHAADYSAIDSSGAVMTATDADVGVITAHTCRLVLDQLLGKEPSQFPYPIYLIGLARSWVFSAPFHVLPIDVPNESTSTPNVDQEAINDALAFIVQLVKETDEDPPPS